MDGHGHFHRLRALSVQGGNTHAVCGQMYCSSARYSLPGPQILCIMHQISQVC